MKSDLIYPSATVIKSWGELLIISGFAPRYLPEISDVWSRQMEDCFQLVKLLPDHNDVATAGARLFYKIIKRHERVDGNKRSALICVYLFFLLNDCRLELNDDDLYHLAKRVARSKGKQDNWIARIHSAFKPNLKIFMINSK